MLGPDDPLIGSFLLACFEEFFDDLLRVKGAVIYDPWDIATKGVDEEGRRSLRVAAAHSVRHRFQALFEQQEADAKRRRGDHSANSYREAEYVMAALADETFLYLDWPGREAWGHQLLETQLFGTQVAGERIFQRVEHFLAQRDPAEREIQLIYLLALSLGFQGRYRGQPGDELERMRDQLYKLVFPREPSVADAQRPLFPQSYQHTLDRDAPIRLPTIGRWAAALAVVAMIYTGIAHLTWSEVTDELRQVNSSIQQIAR